MLFLTDSTCCHVALARNQTGLWVRSTNRLSDQTVPPVQRPKAHPQLLELGRRQQGDKTSYQKLLVSAQLIMRGSLRAKSYMRLLQHYSLFSIYWDTYKLLCFIKIGRLSNAAVSSAMARRALNSRMKNITPPRVKTPELFTVSPRHYNDLQLVHTSCSADCRIGCRR